MENRSVLHVITTIERGGAEKALRILAAEQARRGWFVRIVPLKGIPELASDFELDNVTVDLSLLNKSIFKQLKILRNLAKQFCTVHAHLPRAELFIRLTSKKIFIVTRHNAEQFCPFALQIISSCLSRFVTAKTTHVIAISEAVRSFLISNNEIHKNASCTVIHYGYMSNIEDVGAFANRAKNPYDFHIGTVSRIVSQKNLLLFLQMAARIHASQSRVRFSIVGEGPLRLELENYVDQNNLSDAVKFLGRTSDVLKFMTSLDIFVLTSNYEGFGMVLVEAMDVGIPIVAPRNSSIPEVLGESHPGLYVTNNLDSLTNRMNELLSNKDLRSSIVLGQRNRLKLFSVEKYYSNHEAIYNQFLGIVQS